jgi:RNA-directed DNA polymerase
MQRWPSPRAMKRVRERIHELTDCRRSGKDLRSIIESLNPVLRGWGNYFRTGNADAKFNQVDRYVHQRLYSWLVRRGGQRRRVRHAAWPPLRFFAIGLYRLQGTVCYPVHATQ